MGKHEGMPYKSGDQPTHGSPPHKDVYFYEGGKEHKGWVKKSHVPAEAWRWERPKPPAKSESSGK